MTTTLVTAGPPTTPTTPTTPAAPAAPTTPGDTAFESFASICERLAGFDGRLDPFHVDGWLAVLACGPVRLPAAQWLEAMGDDAFDRAFADPTDRAQALAGLEARLQALHGMLDAEVLLKAPDTARLEPYFDDWAGGEEEELAAEGEPTQPPLPEPPLPKAALPEPPRDDQVGTTWAEGVIDALEVLAAPGGPWALADEAQVTQVLDEIADQVLVLLMDREGDDFRQHVEKYLRGKAPSRDDLLLNACFALQDLRLFLLDHGPRPETRRVESKPGRNDPCPCGSGKKYKKCHGAAEAG
ncbi:MAG: UPF0149 family protein [Rubrivivax sp.]|nr:UPF0149 family protein [Rubrivivax sp.]